MKALLFAGLAASLVGLSLQAQEQPGSPAITQGSPAPTQVAPAGQPPSLQQLLQMVTDLQRQSASSGTSANPPADQKSETSLVQQVIRLATLEITQLQQKLKEDDGGDASVSKDAAAAAAPADGSSVPAPATPSLTDEAFAKFAHAWDSSLSTGRLRTGGLQTGSLQTGGLQTGSLQTGHLSTSSVPSDATTGTRAPSQNVAAQSAVVPFATTNAAPTGAPAVMNPPSTRVPQAVNPPPADASANTNALPADPDDAMLRWSQRIDRQYADEQVARRAAVRLYPSLAVAHSAFNKQFLARYAQYRQADPFGLLRGPGWPVKLAIVTANDLQRQRGSVGY